MHRPFTLPRVAAATLLAALLAGCRPPAPDPFMDRVRLVTDGPQAASAVAGVLQAYGGVEAWERQGNVEYLYTLSFYGGRPEPLRVTRQLQRLGLGEATQIYIEDLDTPAPQIARLDGDQFSLTGGSAEGDPSQAEFKRTYARIVRWNFLLPWVLLDPASRLESRGVRTPPSAGPVPAGPCDVLRLRFQRPTDGGGTDDWHDIYISRLSRLIEQVHSYRAQANDYLLTVWSEHKEFGGLRIATRRATYASDAGASVGKREAVAEYTDVRFDAPFEKGIFHDPLAGAPAGDETVPAENGRDVSAAPPPGGGD